MLPRIDTPTYELTLPSTKKKLKFRPFLVKEEKILLMAQEGDTSEEKIDAVKQIIRNCILQDIDVDRLSTFDIEYIFIQLRSKSVGNIIQLNYKRENCADKEDGAGDCQIPFLLNLDDTKIENMTQDHSNEIVLTDEISILMKYPDFSLMNQLVDAESYDDLVELIANCIEFIKDSDEMHNVSDYTSQDVKDFIENLTQNQFEKINEFFENMPETTCDVNITCSKCGFKKEMKVRGISDFFS